MSQHFVKFIYVTIGIYLPSCCESYFFEPQYLCSYNTRSCFVYNDPANNYETLFRVFEQIHSLCCELPSTSFLTFFIVEKRKLNFKSTARDVLLCDFIIYMMINLKRKFQINDIYFSYHTNKIVVII